MFIRNGILFSSFFSFSHMYHSPFNGHTLPVYTQKGHTSTVVCLVNSLWVDATNKGNIAVILYNRMYVEYSEMACIFCSSIFCNLKIVEIWETLNCHRVF